MRSILRVMMTVSSASARVPRRVRPFFVEHHQLAAGGSRRGQEQPVAKLGPFDLVVQRRRQDASAQFLGVVFERDDQHAAALKYVFTGQGISGRERQVLRITQRRLAGAAIGKQCAEETACENVAEQPTARRRLLGVVAGIPYRKSSGFLEIRFFGAVVLVLAVAAVVVVKVRIWVLQTGIQAGFQRCRNSLNSIFGGIAVGGDGLDQRFLDPGAIDPATRDHAAELEGDLVQRFVAAAACGGGELFRTLFECSSRIGAFPVTGLAVGPRLLTAISLLFIAVLLRLEAKIFNQHFSGGVEERDHIGLADIRKIFAPDLTGFAAVPRIRFAGARMNSRDYHLLAMRQDFDLLLAAVWRREPALDLLERLICPQQDHTLWWPAEPGQNITTSLEVLARQCLDRGCGIGVRNIDVDPRRVARQNSAVRRIGILFPADNNFVRRLDILPAGDRWCLAVDRQRAIAGREQTLAAFRGAIEH